MSTLAVNTITDVAGSLPPVFPAGSAQLNPLADREDKIINGNFGVWQRATTSTASGYVAADRWQNGFIGGTVTQARQAFPLGDALGATQPTYFLRQTVSGQSLASQIAYTVQNIEGVRSYAGQTITVLGWARRSSGVTGNMAVEGAQNFGTGGSPSAAVTGINPTTVTLGTTWAPFAVVLNIPSITGKTLGSNNNDILQVNFWTSAGSDFNARTSSLGLQTIGVDLWGIHIRQGTWTAAATADYRPRDPGTELALCQRYYQQWDLTANVGATGATGLVAAKFSGTDSLIASLPLRAAMRATAIVTTSTSTARAVLNSGAGITVTTFTYTCPVTGPITLLYNNNALPAGFGWIDTIGILRADAEI